jgi:hypothetical protein
MIGYLARDARLHQDSGTPFVSHVSYNTSYKFRAPTRRGRLRVLGQLDEILDDPAERAHSDGEVTLAFEQA